MEKSKGTRIGRGWHTGVVDSSRSAGLRRDVMTWVMDDRCAGLRKVDDDNVDDGHDVAGASCPLPSNVHMARCTAEDG